jgi:alpha-tubulin N-acetyltransferase 1
MLNVENQTAYILVDRLGNNGMGSVVGLLKVGRKKLFLLDEVGKPNEMVPQCVLDFYVVEGRQRSGCGKSLFEFMLRGEEVKPRYVLYQFLLIGSILIFSLCPWGGHQSYGWCFVSLC